MHHRHDTYIGKAPGMGSSRRRRASAFVALALAALVAVTVPVALLLQRSHSGPLTTAQQVTTLAAANAQHGVEARLTGVVTYCDRGKTLVVQDASGGCLVDPSGDRTRYQLGDAVEVVGTTA